MGLKVSEFMISNFRRGDSTKHQGGEWEDETEERVVQTGFVRVEM